MDHQIHLIGVKEILQPLAQHLGLRGAVTGLREKDAAVPNRTRRRMPQWLERVKRVESARGRYTHVLHAVERPVQHDYEPREGVAIHLSQVLERRKDPCAHGHTIG